MQVFQGMSRTKLWRPGCGAGFGHRWDVLFAVLTQMGEAGWQSGLLSIKKGAATCRIACVQRRAGQQTTSQMVVFPAYPNKLSYR